VKDERWEGVGKGPSHARDTVLSPCGDVEGPFRGWLHENDLLSEYLMLGGEGVEHPYVEALQISDPSPTARRPARSVSPSRVRIREDDAG